MEAACSRDQQNEVHILHDGRDDGRRRARGRQKGRFISVRGVAAEMIDSSDAAASSACRPTCSTCAALRARASALLWRSPARAQLTSNVRSNVRAPAACWWYRLKLYRIRTRVSALRAELLSPLSSLIVRVRVATVAPTPQTTSRTPHGRAADLTRARLVETVCVRSLVSTAAAAAAAPHR